ncbi:MAG: hypothetical protein LLF28_04575 [Nitrospiraceae bacterium]|nr:hypothetical protein [Nitrospiraceae bacterium]
MPNALTSDFELAAQISENVVSRILEGAYLHESIPHKITRNFNQSGTGGNADIDLFMPYMNFDVISSDPNPIEIIFPIKARLNITNPAWGEFNVEGDLSVITSVEKIRSFDSSIGADVDVVVVNFTDLSDEDYTIHIVDDIEHKEIIELIIKEMIRQTLQNETQKIALSPGVTHGTNSVQFFEMKIVNDRTPADLDYMALLMNFSNTHTTPGTINPFIRPNKDFALAISRELVQTKFNDAITAKFGSLPARMPSDSSIVLRSLNMSLENGHIHVSGSLTKEIDCWPDADVDFSGDITLSVGSGGQLVASSHNVDVDLPWWADFLGAIIPIIGWIALAVIYDVVEDMAGDLLAGEITGAFSDLSLFPSTIPQVGGMVEEAPSFSTRNDDVEIRQEGLIIHGSVFLDEDVSVTSYPLVGNKRTCELHYANCYWVTQMFDHNKKGFGRREDAISMGYNGCWYCMRDYDTG